MGSRTGCRTESCGNRTGIVRQGRKKYSLLRLPKYLILHMKRFTRNNFFMEVRIIPESLEPRHPEPDTLTPKL